MGAAAMQGLKAFSRFKLYRCAAPSRALISRAKQPLFPLMLAARLPRMPCMPCKVRIRMRPPPPSQEPAMINRLTDSLEFHTQALSLRAERQRLIASNIANADTPGFQARDFDFAAALRAASGNNALGEGIAQGVMQGAGSGPASPVLRYAVPSQTNLDNNSVDMDRERSAFVDNSVKYESTLRFINASVRTTLDAMKSYHQA
jgi:flagellar basal-body rod protein FlgB